MVCSTEETISIWDNAPALDALICMKLSKASLFDTLPRLPKIPGIGDEHTSSLSIGNEWDPYNASDSLDVSV